MAKDSKAKKEKETKTISQKTERYFEAVGRRKTAVARVRIFVKKGDFLVNEKPYQEYFPTLDLRVIFEASLKKAKVLDKLSATIKVKGGGPKGQVGACLLGLARALVKYNPNWRTKMKKAGFLSRDPRMVERKKYGLKKARRAPQWQKR